MNRLLTFALSLSLTLAACVAISPDTLPTDGPLGRQVQRVVDRHDSYVLADPALEQAGLDLALGQSAALQALVGLPEVGRGAFRLALAPVAARHDAYVRVDAALEDIEREQYLASSDSLQRLAGAGE